MRVLHIVNTALPLEGGHSLRNHNIFKQLIRKIDKLTVAVSVFEINEKRLSRSSCFEEDNVLYIHVITQKMIKYLLRFYRNAKLNKPLQFILLFINYFNIKKHININEYDIIHGHSGYNNGMSAYLIAKKYKKKFIYDLHALTIDNIKSGTLKYRIAKWMETFLIQKADVLITIDPDLKNQIIREFKVSADLVFPAPNGIDSVFFHKNNNLSKEEFIGKNRFIVGVDNSKSIENFHYILDNSDQIIKIFPNIYFVVFANKDLNLRVDSKYFKILPKLEFKDMPNYYSILDLFIMPRLRNKMTETVTPLKILEIMSCEIPILVSNVNGLTACIKHSETGFIFNLEEGLSSLINSIYEIQQTQRIDEIGRNARSWVISNKSWEYAASQYMEAYKKTLINQKN